MLLGECLNCLTCRGNATVASEISFFTQGAKRGAACRVLKIEYGAGEFAFLGAGFHDSGENGNFHTESGDGRGMGFVGGVNDESAGEVGVEFGDAEGGGIVAELSEHFVGGTL